MTREQHAEFLEQAHADIARVYGAFGLPLEGSWHKDGYPRLWELKQRISEIPQPPELPTRFEGMFFADYIPSVGMLVAWLDRNTCEHEWRFFGADSRFTVDPPRSGDEKLSGFYHCSWCDGVRGER